ncbi:hypothetical protein COLO4_21791 [Corchorus olitorius]|uniref:Uncharacterized protein n=1 Tax=Corchorus olitorius TaxID=93759 RepID=A0A1R3IR24_9ROSI|nr:hypothetical protein COLO4_21791 [Corchorus olitorius]
MGSTADRWDVLHCCCCWPWQVLTDNKAVRLSHTAP